MQKSFSMAGVQHKSLEIDNIWGSIEVVGANSDQVQLTVNKSIRAESKDGVLTIHVPKTKVEPKKPTTIKVQ